MNSAIAEWLGAHMRESTRILYLPGGPHQIGRCMGGSYDVIATQCKPEDLDDRDTMACLWRLGYDFAAAGGVLLLEISGCGELAPEGKADRGAKLSAIGWSQWDSMGCVLILQRVQTLAPWLSNDSLWFMQPNMVEEGAE